MSLCVKGRFQTRNRVCSWLAEKRAGSCTGSPPWTTKKTKKLRFEMDAQLTAKAAWVTLFVREAGERGYTIEDIAALLHEPGMTAKEALERLLSAEN